MGRRFGSKVKSRNVVSLTVPKLLSIYYRAVNVFSTEFLYGMGLLTIPQGNWLFSYMKITGVQLYTRQ